MPGVEITRCLCRNLTFAQLLPLAQANAWDLPALVRETGCGAGCGLCRPYLRRMLETGETVFHELLWDEGR
jgi:bacterioferritin-associated ferredoxin